MLHGLWLPEPVPRVPANKTLHFWAFTKGKLRVLQALARLTRLPWTFCMSANGLLQDAASPPKQGCEELLIDTARELLGDTGGMSDLSMLRRASLWPIWALTANARQAKR